MLHIDSLIPARAEFNGEAFAGIVVWINCTINNYVRIKNAFTKYFKESCLY